METISIEDKIQQKEQEIATRLEKLRNNPDFAEVLSDEAHCSIKAISELPKLSFPEAVTYFNQANIRFDAGEEIGQLLAMYLDKEDLIPEKVIA